MKGIFVLIPSFVLLFGCTKVNDSGEVWIRLENATSFILERAKVETADYGDVMVAGKTGYQRMIDPVYSGYCVFMRGGVQSGAGYGICGSPMPPPFEPGYYTFKVEGTGTAFNSLTVTKDK